MDEKFEKPPLGLRPRWVVLKHRLQEIDEAIQRYNKVSKPVPEDWIKEREYTSVELQCAKKWG